MSARIIVGDCRVSMAQMETASVDSIVCDPPYELGFMGKSWDASGIAYDLEVWRQALRVLKPGGYLLAFSATRTYHRMTCAIEDAGFEIRDCIGWHYGSGFPKSLDVSKAIDKAAGAERRVIGPKVYGDGHIQRNGTPRNGSGRLNLTLRDGVDPDPVETAPATDDARRWSGWGTALKPAWEPVVVARKPLEGTVAANVLKYGTGALNVDGCRVEGEGNKTFLRDAGDRPRDQYRTGTTVGPAVPSELGRWPANIILSHAPDCGEDGCAPGCPCAAMDAQSGERKGMKRSTLRRGATTGTSIGGHGVYGESAPQEVEAGYSDTGGASRFFSNLPIEADDLVPFFYTAKPGRSEREDGCEMLNAKPPPAVETKVSLKSPRAGAGRLRESVINNHPTVKPISVMAWCIRLVTPPGGLVLDPFTGSGTTGVAARREGMRFVGCELSEEYAEIARARIRQARGSLFAGGVE
jgi:site-specific DNA-methyltransferase (adenine-specific)